MLYGRLSLSDFQQGLMRACMYNNCCHSYVHVGSNTHKHSQTCVPEACHLVSGSLLIVRGGHCKEIRLLARGLLWRFLRTWALIIGAVRLGFQLGAYMSKTSLYACVYKRDRFTGQHSSAQNLPPSSR